MTDSTQTESSHANQSTKAREPATRHRYDNPRLSPRGFLLAVMRSPDAPLHARIDAAVKLLHLWPDDFDDSEPVLKYQIGGIPIQ
jgi:hypothetical protein